MKPIKTYLVVVTLLLFMALGFGVYVWYTIQKFDATEGVEIINAEDVRDASSTTVNDEPTATDPIVIQTSELPQAQQEILKGIGYSSETFTITGAMMMCAEDAIGVKRLEEITGGAAPTPLESLKLLPCLKSR